MLAPKDLRTWEVQSRDTRPKHVKNLVFYRVPGNRTFPRWSNSSCFIGTIEFIYGSLCKSAVFCRDRALITPISVDPALPKSLFPSIRCLHKPYFRRSGACKNPISVDPVLAQTLFMSTRCLPNPYFRRTGACNTLFLSTRYLHKPYFCRFSACLAQFQHIMYMHQPYFLRPDVSVTHLSIDPTPPNAKVPSSLCFHKTYEH